MKQIKHIDNPSPLIGHIVAKYFNKEYQQPVSNNMYSIVQDRMISMTDRIKSNVRRNTRRNYFNDDNIFESAWNNL